MLNGHAVRCGCGFKELTKQEQRDLPQKDGVYYCFQSCLDQARQKWRMRQERLGFTFGQPDYDVDVAELEGR